MKQTYLFFAAALCLLCTSPAIANEDTDSLYVNGLLTAPETFFLSDDDSNMGESYYQTSISSGAFSLSHYWGPWGFGGGFTYSNCTDVTTPGYSNMSAYAAQGIDGDSYLISNSNSYTPAEVSFNDGYTHKPLGAYFTNASYTALSMLQGDSYGKKFGGDEGTDPDWFVVTITGYDLQGKVTGSTDFYLADYRAEDSAEDYIVKDWAWVDLTPLGEVAKIDFLMSSSDNGLYGMNTPSYFCMDGLKVEKGTYTSVAEVLPAETGRVFYANRVLHVQGLQGANAVVYTDKGEMLGSFFIDNDAYGVSLPVSSGTCIVKVTTQNTSQVFKVAIQ